MAAMKKILVIQNCETEGFGFYKDYLLEKEWEHAIFPAYSKLEFPPLGNYVALIVGGTPISVREIESHDFLKREWDYLSAVLKKGLPVLGICFGGQIIARILGAEVKKNPVMEIGVYEVALTAQGKEDPFFAGFEETFPVFHWHGDAFDVPSGAALMARGKDCPNQAFRFENSLALQFHLEVAAAEAAKWAEIYKDELGLVNKTAGQVVKELVMTEEKMKSLAYQLMRNFLKND
jgi:GMP synthase (glutamine-hydrolysing)